MAPVALQERHGLVRGDACVAVSLGGGDAEPWWAPATGACDVWPQPTPIHAMNGLLSRGVHLPPGWMNRTPLVS